MNVTGPVPRDDKTNTQKAFEEQAWRTSKAFYGFIFQQSLFVTLINQVYLHLDFVELVYVRLKLLCETKANGAKARSSEELKFEGCKQHSSGKLKFSSSQTNARFALTSQAALSYRAAVATDAKPRAEISLLNLCRGAKEKNCKLTDAFIPRRHLITTLTITSFSSVAMLTLLTTFHFADIFISDIVVAIEVQSCGFIVQMGACLTFVEEFEGLYVGYIEPRCKND